MPELRENPTESNIPPSILFGMPGYSQHDLVIDDSGSYETLNVYHFSVQHTKKLNDNDTSSSDKNEMDDNDVEISKFDMLMDLFPGIREMTPEEYEEDRKFIDSLFEPLE